MLEMRHDSMPVELIHLQSHNDLDPPKIWLSNQHQGYTIIDHHERGHSQFANRLNCDASSILNTRWHQLPYGEAGSMRNNLSIGFNDEDENLRERSDGINQISEKGIYNTQANLRQNSRSSYIHENPILKKLKVDSTDGEKPLKTNRELLEEKAVFKGLRKHPGEVSYTSYNEGVNNQLMSIQQYCQARYADQKKRKMGESIKMHESAMWGFQRLDEDRKYDWVIEDIFVQNSWSTNVRSGKSQIIGKGAFGNVIKVKDNNTQIQYALKFIKKSFYSKAITETEIMKKFHDYAHIIQYHDIYMYDQQTERNHAIEIQQYLVIVMELAQASLEDILKLRISCQAHWTYNELLTIFRHIALALQSLAHKNIAHRDVKPSNILYCLSTMKYKLADFGEAKIVEKLNFNRAHSPRGTKRYMSPELLNGLNKINGAAASAQVRKKECQQVQQNNQQKEDKSEQKDKKSKEFLTQIQSSESLQVAFMKQPVDSTQSGDQCQLQVGLDVANKKQSQKNYTNRQSEKNKQVADQSGREDAVLKLVNMDVQIKGKKKQKGGHKDVVYEPYSNDIYSLGICYFQIKFLDDLSQYKGHEGKEADTEDYLKQKLKAADPTDILIRRMTNLNARERPTINQVLDYINTEMMIRKSQQIEQDGISYCYESSSSSTNRQPQETLQKLPCFGNHSSPQHGVYEGHSNEACFGKRECNSENSMNPHSKEYSFDSNEKKQFQNDKLNCSLKFTDPNEEKLKPPCVESQEISQYPPADRPAIVAKKECINQSFHNEMVMNSIEGKIQDSGENKNMNPSIQQRIDSLSIIKKLPIVKSPSFNEQQKFEPRIHIYQHHPNDIYENFRGSKIFIGDSRRQVPISEDCSDITEEDEVDAQISASKDDLNESEQNQQGTQNEKESNSHDNLDSESHDVQEQGKLEFFRIETKNESGNLFEEGMDKFLLCKGRREGAGDMEDKVDELQFVRLMETKRHSNLTKAQRMQLYIARAQAYESLLKLQKALDTYQELYASQFGQLSTEDQINLLKNLGRLEHKLSKFDSSIKYYEQLLELLKQSGEVNDFRQISDVYQMLGSAHCFQGDYTAALKYYAESLAKKELLRDSIEEEEIADLLVYIGLVKKHLQQYPSSLENYEKALKIINQNPQKNLKRISCIKKNIGSVYDHLQNIESSISFLQAALQDTIKAYGYESERVVNCLNKLGVVLVHSGAHNHAAAIAHFEKAMQIMKKLFKMDTTNENHRNQFKFKDEPLGDTIQPLYTRALRVNEEAYILYRQVYDYFHIAVAIILEIRGMIYHFLKDFRSSLKYYNEALNIYTTILKPEHEFVKRSKAFIEMSKKHQKYENFPKI